MASNCLASCDRIVANFRAPAASRSKFRHGCLRYVWRVLLQKKAEECQLLPRVCLGLIIRLGQCTGQELMARISHAAQIDLRFGDPARELLDFGVGPWPGNFARERFHLFGQGWIGANGQAQPVAKRVSRRASAALAVFGPVLARAFARLALILRSLVKPRFFLWLASSRSL